MSYNSEEYKKVSPWGVGMKIILGQYMGMKYADQQNPYKLLTSNLFSF